MPDKAPVDEVVMVQGIRCEKLPSASWTWVLGMARYYCDQQGNLSMGVGGGVMKLDTAGTLSQAVAFSRGYEKAWYRQRVSEV
jgi:hypothetical protein